MLLLLVPLVEAHFAYLLPPGDGSKALDAKSWVASVQFCWVVFCSVPSSFAYASCRQWLPYSQLHGRQSHEHEGGVRLAGRNVFLCFRYEA